MSLGTTAAHFRTSTPPTKLTLYLSPKLPRMDFGEFRTTEMISCRRIEMWMNSYHTRYPYHEDRVWLWQPLLMRHMPQISQRDNHIQDTNSWIERPSIVWSSTRQVTVEISTFSAEFIALTMCIEEIDHFGFKQRWFGIPMPKEDPSYEYCNNESMVNFDNESVVKNATNVESTLKTKHASVAYHHYWWFIAAGVVTLTHISAHDNIADCLSKRLPAGKRNLFGEWTYHWQVLSVANSGPTMSVLDSRGPSKCDCYKNSTDVRSAASDITRLSEFWPAASTTV